MWPEEVLPLVVDRFQNALTTDVATHQLPAAINTLAMCVRPMLLAGWGTPEETAPQVGGFRVRDGPPGLSGFPRELCSQLLLALSVATLVLPANN